MATHSSSTSTLGVSPQPAHALPIGRMQAYAWLALGYAALAAYSVAMSRQPGSLAVLWFANAWAVPLWLSQPRAQWPGLLAVQALANAAVGMAFGDGMQLAFAFALANGLEVALVAALLQWRWRGRTEDWAPEGVALDFLLCRALTSGVGAVMGAGILAGVGLGSFEAILPVWWLGSLFGHLTLAFPLRYLSSKLGQPAVTGFRLLDVGVMALIVVMSAAMVIELSRPFIYVAGVMVVGLLAMRPVAVAIAVPVLGFVLSFAHALETSTLPVTKGWWGHDEDLVRLIAVMLVANALLVFKLRNEQQMASLTAERAAVQGLSLQNKALLHSSMAGLMYARNRTIEWVNPEFARMLGYTEAELIGQSTRLMYADQAGFEAVGREGYESLKRTGSFTRQVACRTKAGERVHWLIKGAYLEGQSGVVYVSCMDVTETVKQRQEMEVALRAAGLAYFEFDAKRMTSYWDETLCRIYGLGEQPHGLWVPSARFFDMLVKDEKGQASMADEAFMQAQGEHFKATYAIRRPDGEIRHIEGVSVNQFDEAGQLVRRWGFERDITRRHLQGVALAQALEAAKQADRAKTDFLNNISHEMRTPLNGLLGYSQVLATTELSAAQQGLLSKLTRAGQGLLALINDVLDFSKLQSGQFGLVQAPLRVPVLVREAFDIIAPMAEAKQVNLTVASVPKMWCQPWVGDAQRLRQMLLNLLSNAVKFTPRGGEVKVRVSTEGTACRFDVVDTGVGIAPEQLGRLFARFQQLDNSGTRTVQGTGLGLAIVKELALQMGGDVAVTSTQGQGSVFSFWVRFSPCDDDAHAATPVGQASAAADEGRTPLQGLRVLVVDDSEMNLDVASHLLSAAGAEVHTAEHGQAALDWLAQHGQQVDVVLMDVHMPVMGGIEACRQLRRMPGLALLPVVALTAAATQDDQTAVLDAGMNGYLLKPYGRHELMAVVAKHGRAHQASLASVGSGAAHVHQPQAHAAGLSFAGVANG